MRIPKTERFTTHLSPKRNYWQTRSAHLDLRGNSRDLYGIKKPSRRDITAVFSRYVKRQGEMGTREHVPLGQDNGAVH